MTKGTKRTQQATMKKTTGPTNHALIIASDFAGLKGTTNDADAMTAALQRHDFTVVKCCSPDSTRANILNELEMLTQRVHQGDAVVIYYSGHGGLVEAESNWEAAKAGRKPLRRFQFIYPVNFDMSIEGGFHGIMDVELSHYTRTLIRITENTTVIFDCCHSARMTRYANDGIERRARGLPLRRRYDLSGHVA
ncbi:hypothetical protein EKO04_008961 [Ascochyta lentis]|uniref:Peptidase C14 caspase domain-containing protein n=1 Tax=Ascochyta lentis TaxID=205686 RepID=A0A8H7IY34_9PLEO|nr:hypothetical protein EKO04_008961 [Ascochyta lentis]